FLVEFVLSGAFVEAGVEPVAAEEEMVDEDVRPRGIKLRARIAGGAHDAAPVGVAAGDGRLDERRVRNRARDAFGVARVSGPRDFDGDELARPFAVPGDHLRKRLAEFGEPREEVLPKFVSRT